jgi:hypothetical protein
VRSYKRELKTLKAKLPEPPPLVEDSLTEDARHIHAFLVVTAQENGEELPTTTVEEIRAYLEHRENMTQEERREEIIRGGARYV